VHAVLTLALIVLVVVLHLLLRWLSVQL